MSVAQLPGSMYPTATRKPGPENANSFRQKLTLAGTLTDRCTSRNEGMAGALSYCLGGRGVISVRAVVASARVLPQRASRLRLSQLYHLSSYRAPAAL